MQNTVKAQKLLKNHLSFIFFDCKVHFINASLLKYQTAISTLIYTSPTQCMVKVDLFLKHSVKQQQILAI